MKDKLSNFYSKPEGFASITRADTENTLDRSCETTNATYLPLFICLDKHLGTLHKVHILI